MPNEILDPTAKPGDIHNEGITMSTDQSTPAEEPAASPADESPAGNHPAGEEQQSPTPKRKRRWLRILVWLIVIGMVSLVVLIALLPTILSSGPVTRRIAAGASKGLDRDVSIGDLALDALGVSPSPSHRLS